MCRCRIWQSRGLIRRGATTSFATCLQRISRILLAAIAEPNASQGELGQLYPTPYRSCLVELGKVGGMDLIRSAPGLPLRNSLQSLLPLTQGKGIEAEQSRRTKRRRYSGSKHIPARKTARGQPATEVTLAQGSYARICGDSS